MAGRDPDSGLAAIVRNLQGLGFSDYEARAYVSLLKVQPATAYEVSKDAGIPKANCYTVLETLSKRDAVQPVTESPVRYAAVPPEALFARIANSTRQRCADVVRDLEVIAAQPTQDHVWSLGGRAAIDQRISQLIETAQRRLWVKGAAEALTPHLPELRACAERGVSVHIILFGDDPQPFRFGGASSRCWLHEGNGLAVGVADRILLIARDHHEAMIADLSEPAQASVTRNHAVVNLVDTLIRHEIYFAEIFEAFGDRIMDRFGPALFRLRRSHLPPAQVADLAARLGLAPDAD